LVGKAARGPQRQIAVSSEIRANDNLVGESGARGG